jgi:hypothetical protein
MKRRYRYTLNLLSLGLLLFALYLNFVRKEPVDATTPIRDNSSSTQDAQVKQTSALTQAAKTFDPK